MIRAACYFLLAVLLTSASVLADPIKPDVLLDVEIGWGGPLRAGRWTPMFVTASDALATQAKPRAVTIAVESEQGGTSVMQISQSAAIGPIPATFTILLPLSLEAPVVTLRDQATGKTLAVWSRESARAFEDVSRRLLDGDKNLIGVSGAYSKLPNLTDQADLQAEVGFLPPDRLPIQPLGYDSLDLLILNRPNVNHISADSQAAIVEWVRGGGVLLIWPGSDPLPAGPLADALPCKIGIPRSYTFSLEQQYKAGLAKRFGGMTGYQLTPTKDADPIPLFTDSAGQTDAIAYSKRVGFGRITVAPFDVSLFQFKNMIGGTEPSETPDPTPESTPDASESRDIFSPQPRVTRPRGPGREFFEQLTARMGLYELRQKAASGSYRYRYSESDPINSRQQQATARLEDFLGDVPGAGRFGFGYIAWVMLGMMVLVGPVDWFVLRKLGRQPWTWVTTAGWIGLITVGALMIARVFKSGDLYFNTVELIDQADDQVVARSTLVGIYSPKTTEYHIDGPAGAAGGSSTPVTGWWSLPSSNEYSRSGLKTDTAFHQAIDGMEPLEMTINVWKLRFLSGQTLGGKQDPILAADLHVRSQTASETKPGEVSKQVLEGIIRNLSTQKLIDIRLATGRHSIVTGDSTNSEILKGLRGPSKIPDVSELGQLKIIVPQLGPNQSSTVSVVLDSSAILANGIVTQGNSSPVYYNNDRYGYSQTPPLAESIWAVAGDLATRRTWRMGQEAADGKTAVIFARIENPSPPVSLREPNAKQKHEAVVRAVVRIRE